jgi:carbon-monoxide dehydrogenase medium subunit/xanthine dehydrogenase FAD-binding subunit
VRRVIFHRARDLAQAVALAAEHGARGRLLAGGTDLIVALRKQTRAPEPLHLIDLTAIAPGGDGERLRAITLEDGRFSIGALVTHAEIVATPLVRRALPLLARACEQIGSVQIRNRGTLGGNLCNASPCADAAPPLIALGAELTLQSARGVRHVALCDALRAPYETALAPEEILTRIDVRPPAPGTGTAFLKLGRRNAVSVSRMSIAVLLRRDAEDRLQDVRIAAGSIAPIPQRFPKIEVYLNGHATSSARIAEAGRQLSQEMIRLCGRRWSTPYKEPVAAALLGRALESAIEETRQDG